jgi:hypothetical protein
MTFIDKATDMLHWLYTLQVYNYIHIVKKLSLHYVGIVSNRMTIVIR